MPEINENLEAELTHVSVEDALPVLSRIAAGTPLSADLSNPTIVVV